MNESLMLSNVYAAYTAASNSADRNISRLSEMVKSDKAGFNLKENSTQSLHMDTVIISKEALEMLHSAGHTID